MAYFYKTLKKFLYYILRCILNNISFEMKPFVFKQRNREREQPQIVNIFTMLWCINIFSFFL